jgi:hypothetical protein
MSISISSNMSDIQTDVSEKITNTTNPTLVSNNGIVNTFTAKGKCNFTIESGASFDTSVIAAQTQNIKQLSQVTSSTSMDADVMTALAQDSTASGSGLLSIGFAGAFNSATSIVTAGAAISNAVSSAVSTVNATTSGITCEDEAVVTIAGNWNAQVNTNQDLVTSQYVQSDQVAAISSSVSQKITQSATSTMEAMSTGALVVLGLIILLLVFGKPIIDAINRGKGAAVAGAAGAAVAGAAGAAGAAVAGAAGAAGAAVAGAAGAAVAGAAADVVASVAGAAVGATTAAAAATSATALNWYGALLALGGAVGMTVGGLSRQFSDPCNSTDQCRAAGDTTSTCSCTDHYTCGVNEDHTDVALPVSSPPQMFLFSIYEENAALLYNASLRRMAVRTFATFNSANPLMSNSGWNCGVYFAMKKFCMSSSVNSTVPQRAMGGLLRCFGRMVQSGDIVSATDFGDSTDWNGLPNGQCISGLVDCLLPLTPFHLHNKFLPPSICATKDPNNKTCSVSTLTDFQDASVDDASIAVNGAAAAIVDTGPTFDQIFGLALRKGETSLVPLPTSLGQNNVWVTGAAPNVIRPMCYQDTIVDGTVVATKFFERTEPNGSCPSGMKPMWMGPSAKQINHTGRSIYSTLNPAKPTYIARAPFGANNTGAAGLGKIDGCMTSIDASATAMGDGTKTLAQGYQIWWNNALQTLADIDVNDSKDNTSAVNVNAPQCAPYATDLVKPTDCTAYENSLGGYTKDTGMHLGFNTGVLTDGLVDTHVVCQQVQGDDTTDTVFYAQLPPPIAAAMDTNYSSQKLEKGATKSMGGSYDQQYCAEAIGLLRAPPDDAFSDNNPTSDTNPAKAWMMKYIPSPNRKGTMATSLIKPYRMQFPKSKYWDTKGNNAYIPSIRIASDADKQVLLSSVGGTVPTFEAGNPDYQYKSRTTVLTPEDQALASTASYADQLGILPIANCTFSVDTSANANVRSCDSTQGITNCWTQVLCEANGGVWSVDEHNYGSCGMLLADSCSAACGNCKTSSACAGQLESMNCQWIEASADGQSYCAEGCSAAANKCSACFGDACSGDQLCQKVTWVGPNSGQTRTACAPSMGSCGASRSDDESGAGCTDPQTGKLVPSLNFDWILMRLPTPFMSGTGASAVPTMSACLPMVFTPSPDGAPYSYDDGSCSSGTECVPSTSADDKNYTDCADTSTQSLGTQSAVADASSIVGTCGYDYQQTITNETDNSTVTVTRDGCYESASAPCACVDAAAAAQQGIVVDDAFRQRRYAQGRRIPNKVSPYCYFSALDEQPSTSNAEKAYNFCAVDNPSQENWVWAQNGDAVKISRWYYINRIFNSILLFNSDPTHFSVLGLSTFMNAGGFADDGQPLYPLTEAGLSLIRQLSATSSAGGDADVWVAFRAQPLLVQDPSGEFQYYTLQEIDAFDSVAKELMLSQLQNFVYSKTSSNWANVTTTSLARLGLGITMPTTTSTADDATAAQNALAAYSGTIFGAMGVCRTAYNTDAIVYGGLVGGGALLGLGAALLATSVMMS